MRSHWLISFLFCEKSQKIVKKANLRKKLLNSFYLIGRKSREKCWDQFFIADCFFSSFFLTLWQLMKVAFHLFDGKYVNSIIFHVKRKIEELHLSSQWIIDAYNMGPSCCLPACLLFCLIYSTQCKQSHLTEHDSAVNNQNKSSVHDEPSWLMILTLQFFMR